MSTNAGAAPTDPVKGSTGAEIGSAPDRVIGGGFAPHPEVTEEEYADFTPAEKERLGQIGRFMSEGDGYFKISGTRPQTMTYGLHDSPVSQPAWIVENVKEWTDSGHALPEDAINRDHILADVALYWFTGTAGSSANLCYELLHQQDRPQPSGVPTGVAVFAEDVAIRRYSEPLNAIVHWSDFETGGHFAALETPDLLVEDVRTFFRGLR